jgi:hypothetical protein
MKVKCIKEIEDNKGYYHQSPIDFSIDKIYFVERSYKGKEMIFGSLETYYVVKDNCGDNHTFNQLGFDQHFISLKKERKIKLEKLLKKH